MTIGWGIIGTGRISSAMTEAIARSSGASAVAVVSRNPERARDFASAHEIPHAFASLAALLDQKDVDIVYVASPNALHREHTLAAAAARKHVLCEKPMAPDVSSCREMIATCAEYGVRLGIAFQYRQHVAHRKMRDIVASGDLGSLTFADAAVYVPPLESTPDWYGDPDLSGGGGILPMSGVHRIDLLRFVLGSEVAAVSAFVGRHDPERTFEDSVSALLRFQDGAIATVRFAYGMAQGGDTFTVHGSEASLVGVGTMSQWWGGDGGEITKHAADGSSAERFEASDLYAHQVEAFSRSLDSDEDLAQTMATGKDGLRASAVAAAIIRASDERRTVPLPVED